MDLLNKILEHYPEDGYVKVDSFDSAIVGISSTGCLVYSIPKIIEILVSRNNWTYKDAADYFFYSIDDVYHGDKAPLFINLINDKE
jgi:hypothetical protein